MFCKRTGSTNKTIGLLGSVFVTLTFFLKNPLLGFSVECTDHTSAGRAAPWRQAEGYDNLHHRRPRQGCGGKAHFSEGKLFLGISCILRLFLKWCLLSRVLLRR